MKTIFDETYIEIITRLRLARLKANITQTQLAKMLNVPQSFISKVECCERRLDIVEFIKWATALSVSFEKILCITNEEDS